MDVKGVGKPSVFQNDESSFYEWAKKIGHCLIGLDPQLVVMLDWALDPQVLVSALFWHVSQEEKAGRSCRVVDDTVSKRGEVCATF